MTGTRIRDVQVAEEIAAQAGTEETPPLFLSNVLQPVIFGPQRPPLATAGYFPVSIGIQSSGVALNTSHAGVFVSGTAARTIARVNSISIQNATGGALLYTIRRGDGAGFTLVPAVPGYIDAGGTAARHVQTATRSDSVGAQGIVLATVQVADGAWEKFDGPWILNEGILTVNPTTVDKDVRIFMAVEVWPAIRRQPPG